MIAQSLETGTDKHVVRALDDLDEAGLEDAVTLTVFCAEMATASASVLLQTPEGKEPGEFRLFLVPALLVMEPDQGIPQSLLDTVQSDACSTLDLCATSLRRYGLIGSEPSVVLLPWLYAYADLPDTWAGRRRMMRHMAEIANGQDAPIVRPKPAETESRLLMSLRFLVFGVFATNEANAGSHPARGPLLDDDLVVESEEEDDEDTVDPRLLAWQEDLAQTLIENLTGVLSARIGTPASWDDAIHEGFDIRNLAGLIATVAPDGNPESLRCSQVAMGLYQVDDDLELRIGISRDERFVNGFIWACHQDPEEEINEAFEALQEIGIPASQIHVAGKVFGDERCPDCGEPSFPVITDESEEEDGFAAACAPAPHRLLH